MEKSIEKRFAWIKDATGLLFFVLAVVIGVLLINGYVFRSFNVEGPSMETTMHTGDRLIVNKLPVTWSQLQNKKYVPERGQIIVFRNPLWTLGNPDEYIVKRVIALPGERVLLNNGKYTVFNTENPDGFNPDNGNRGEPGSPTSGSFEGTVPEDHIFVSGDHRQGNYSFDSRNGLGYIPLYDIIGPVGLRVFPFNAMRSF